MKAKHPPGYRLRRGLAGRAERSDHGHRRARCGELRAHRRARTRSSSSTSGRPGAAPAAHSRRSTRRPRWRTPTWCSARSTPRPSSDARGGGPHHLDPDADGLQGRALSSSPSPGPFPPPRSSRSSRPCASSTRPEPGEDADVRRSALMTSYTLGADPRPSVRGARARRPPRTRRPGLRRPHRDRPARHAEGQARRRRGPAGDPRRLPAAAGLRGPAGRPVDRGGAAVQRGRPLRRRRDHGRGGVRPGRDDGPGRRPGAGLGRHRRPATPHRRAGRPTEED